MMIKSSSMKRSTLNRRVPFIFGCLVLSFFLFSLILYANLPAESREAIEKAKGNQNLRTTVTATLAKKKSKKATNKAYEQSTREIFEKDHDPNNLERLKKVLQDLRQTNPDHPSDLPYDIYNCPEKPPENYPARFGILDVLHDWNPDNTTVPDKIYQSMCVFDWEKDQAKAEAYRQAEVPFVLQNHPELVRASERWTSPGYLSKLLGSIPQRNEYSTSNHMMFWRLRNKGMKPDGWKPPTKDVEISYRQWYQKAVKLESMSEKEQLKSEHWYFRLNGVYGQSNTYLFDELPIFKPTDSSIFMVEPEEARGLNCRFGQRGIIAESHFDTARNWITVMGGKRRYILAHPDQCKNMELYPLNHPSGRHSKIDWSDPPSKEENPTFAAAEVFEVLLQAGDALYLPTYYFHFIVSLNLNYQCNARSGMTNENGKFIQSCGL